MGDRANNALKFGPEWLRNLSPGTSGGNHHNAAMASSPTSSGSGSGNTAGSSNTSNTPSKVLLAKLRYGREEMLALYDKSSEAPPELKAAEVLYQPRGKPPFALNNTFEDEMRDNIRSGPPVGGVSPGDRFGGAGRGMGRGLNVSDGRGRPRVPFVRQPSTGRGGTTWHHGSPKMPGYSGGADEDSALNLRSSWSASNGGNPPNRNPGEQPEWTPNKFRSKRHGQATNWRQTRGEEGDEWRHQEGGGRSRERDWGERPNQEKPQWNSNRRTWVGGDSQNDDNLPEWAVDNAEACGGTFDSSGAFHGYSNDDTNLPKNQDSAYPLTRSHTHGSFARSKTVEEGSEEWWASEKAKKLSPKRFDATDVKFKKQTSAPEGSDASADSKAAAAKDDQLQEVPEKLESTSKSASEPPENASGGMSDDDKFKNAYKPKFSESKTFDSLMRSDINMEETTDDRSNFQSVMITPNNSLRQKHQNIVSAASEMPVRDSNNGKPGILQLIQNNPNNQPNENEMRKHQSPEDKMVDDIFDMTLDEKDILKQHPKPISSPLMNQAASNMSVMASIASSMPQMPMQMSLSSPVFANPGMMGPKQMPNQMQSGLPSGLQGLPTGMQGLPSGMQGLPTGMQGLPAGLQLAGLPPSLQIAGMQALGMQQSGMQGPPMQGTGMQGPGMQVSGMQGSGMQGSGMQGSGMQGVGNQAPGMPGSSMASSVMQGNGMSSVMQSSMQQSMQGPGLQGPVMHQGGNMQPGLQSMQSVGITNSALNASLGLPIRPGNTPIGLPIQGVPPPVMPSSGMGSTMGSSGIAGSGMQGSMGGGPMQPGGTGMPGFPNAGSIPGMSSNNASLFLGQNTNNQSMGNQGDIPMPNHGGQSSMFPMHGLQHSGSQAAFGSSIYSNIMQPPQTPPNPQSLADQWYYEDPKKNIQGPFSSKEMYNWYRAGFFSPSLMVRRACDAHMRPLGSYGPVVPFAQMDMLSSFPMSGGFDRSPGPHDTMLNSQQALGLESVMKMSNINDAPTANSMPFGSVGLIRNPPYGQPQPMVDSLWSQPSPSADMLWMQQTLGRNDNRVNNLPLFFWEQQPSSALASNAMLPEEIAKGMKTEEQILAQLRASQNMSSQQTMYMNEVPVASAVPVVSSKPDEAFGTPTSATPNMEELHKLIQKDTLAAKPANDTGDNVEAQSKPEKMTKVEPSTEVTNQQQKTQKQQLQQQQQQQQQQPKATTETKQSKQAKNDSEKAVKNKEAQKTKNKKKDEKKEEVESKQKDEEVKPEKRSDEPSPAKSKKEDKANNKKELEKEKKEWLKEGFIIVKGSEKSVGKDNKKKAEEAKAFEEAERKRKEEEKLAADEDKKRIKAEAAIRKQQESLQQQQRQAAESVVKKAPWSAVSNPSMFAPSRDGLTLTEIQRLEREKKLEQIKEQHQMMQIIAQNQAAALARDQEMQAGLGWAKKKAAGLNSPGQSLAEIQAETRKQAAAASAAAASAAAVSQALEDGAAPPLNHVPWGSATNGGGFWDAQPNQPPKPIEKPQPQESPKAAEPKPKKKPVVVQVPKKEPSPAVEFESWCTNILASFSSKIDVPTFVGFLKDIESPYEVKDYVKCYLGESKDTNDFSRQFLERRSKLLRVGMVTPSDDLCSPAMAVNPRTNSGSDYQEVKGKGKKTKKNKMLKVDARILGFSVTASEDRINVGDIDTA